MKYLFYHQLCHTDYLCCHHASIRVFPRIYFRFTEREGNDRLYGTPYHDNKCMDAYHHCRTVHCISLHHEKENQSAVAYQSMFCMSASENKTSKNPGSVSDNISGALPGSCYKRLSGVEPPHMPPEGIALSTELQTHSGYKREQYRSHL